MLTGLEPVLLVTGKAVGAGAARALGVAARGVAVERRRRRIRALSVGAAGIARRESIAALEPETAAKLLEFADSSAVEHTATGLAKLFAIEGKGRKADTLSSALRAEFYASLRANVSPSLSDEVCEAVYAAVCEAVLYNVKQLFAKPELVPALEAEVIKLVGSLSAACVRNATLLSGLTQNQQFVDFEEQYRNQAASIHANMKLPHAGTTRQVPYDQLFVNPRVTLTNKLAHSSISSTPGADEFSVTELVRMSTRSVILGNPGGGKSTLTRKLVYDLASDSTKVYGLQRTPFLVELRDYAGSIRGKDRSSLVDYIESICRSPYAVDPPPQAIEWMLLNDRAVVVLDGLDELLDTDLRRDVVVAVEGFAHRYPTCPMIVTSRRVGYEEAPLDDAIFPTVHLAQFDERQVETYVGNWFRLDESVDLGHQATLSKSFIADSVFVSDLRVNPLMLSLMCGIYASENYIPRNRPDVYEKCAMLLFERWDKQRGIHAPLSFDAHVQAAMQSLALYIYRSEATGDPASATASEGMPRDRLLKFMAGYLREKRFDDDNDALNAAVQFIDFCKGRAWVLTDIGPDTYGFTHRTFLEYFAASQLVREHTSAKALYAELRPYIRSGGWDVVAQLALQVLGRATENGADDFLQMLLDDYEEDDYGDVYAASFAARAMQFIVPRPSVVYNIVERAYGLYGKASKMPSGRRRNRSDPHDPEFRLIIELMSASTENCPRVGNALREILRKHLDGDSTSPLPFEVALAPTQRLVHSSMLPEYWQTWAAINLAEFDGDIIAARTRFPWLASVEMERGRVTAGDLLKWHGAGGLFDFRDAMRTRLSPPFFYRYLIMRYRRGYEGTAGRVPPSRSSEIATGLVENLPKVRTPWVPRSEPSLRLAWVIEAESAIDPAANHGANLLLSLLLIEQRARFGDDPRGSSGPLTPWAKTLADARSGAGDLAPGFMLISSCLGEGTAASDFVGRWLRGEFDLIGPTRKRRSSGQAQT